MRCSTWRSCPCAVALIAAALLCFVPSAHADYRLDVDAGLDRNVRANTWAPAFVRLTGTGFDADGEVQIVVRLRNGGVRVYGKPIRLHAGATNEQYIVYYLQPDPGDVQEILVRVLSEGRTVEQKKLEGLLLVQDNQLAIVGLTQDQGGLSYLANNDLGISHLQPSAPNNPYGYGGGNPSAQLRQRTPARVIYPRPSALPDSAGGYAAIDAVMLGDLPLDAMTEDQWAALVTWVKDGGTLLVSGGADINRVRNPKLAELLPVAPEGVRQVRGLPALADRYESQPRLTAAPVIVGSLRSDSMAMCREGALPIVSIRRVGNGTVAFTAFDMLAPEFRAWPGMPGMWRDVLYYSRPEQKGTEIARAGLQMQRTYWGGDTSEGRMLRDALVGSQSTEAPSFTYIGGFLLLYIICLVPVNYFLLRKRDRRELAWITAPVIILLFSTGAYAVGYSIKGGQLYLRSCSVIEGTANNDSWSVYTVASIFSPRQARYDLSIADPAALPTEVTEEASGFDRPVTDIGVLRGQKTTVRDVLVNMWDHRNFDFETHVALGGGVSASAQVADGNAFSVQVTNDTRYTLTDCQVALQGNTAPIGTLKPGEGRKVRVANAASQGSGGIPVMGVQGDPADAVVQIKQAMASMLNNNPGGAPGSPPLVFTGWFAEPTVGLGLDGEHPTVQGANLLVVHIPRPGSSGTVAPPPPPRPSADAAEVPGGPIQRMPNPMYGSPGMANPQNADYWNNQAYAYANGGDLSSAMKAANRAMSLAPTNGDIIDTVAEMHQRRKEYKQAAAFYEKAIKWQSQVNYQTHEKYGETLLAMGKKQAAIKHLQIAAQGNDSWGALARQALKRIGASSSHQ